LGNPLGIMAATEALQRLKHGADAILKNALEQRDRPSSDLAVAAQAQAAQDRLAEEVLAAAKDMDSIFERAKLACTEESEDDVKAEVGVPLRLWRSTSCPARDMSRLAWS
jgi:hypothetical protein